MPNFSKIGQLVQKIPFRGPFPPQGGEPGGMENFRRWESIPNLPKNIYTEFHPNPTKTEKVALRGARYVPAGGVGGVVRSSTPYTKL